jgi:hypothetical protein
MRRLSLAVTLSGLFLVLGCNGTKWNLFRRDTPAETTAAPAPSAAALVYYLNDNASRIQSLQCKSLDLQCNQGIRTVGLRGQMVCQTPRNFRLSAQLFGKQEIDMGSNNEEFWYWIARGDPYQIHCSHQALADGKVKRLPFPVQPDWIMEALGLAKYGPAEQYQVAVKERTVELVQRTRSPQGNPIRKVTVFRRGRAPEGSPQVLAHVLIDETSNKEICSAQVLRVQIDRGTGAIVPQKVVLVWPEGKVRLTMTLDELTVNGQIARPDLLFVRRPLSNVRSYDLAQGRVDAEPTSIRRVDARSWGPASR